MRNKPEIKKALDRYARNLTRAIAVCGPSVATFPPARAEKYSLPYDSHLETLAQIRQALESDNLDLLRKLVAGEQRSYRSYLSGRHAGWVEDAWQSFATLVESTESEA